MNEQWRWGWRQTLSWKMGIRRAKADVTYKCPWWADEEIYGLAYLQGKGVKLFNSEAKVAEQPSHDPAR